MDATQALYICSTVNVCKIIVLLILLHWKTKGTQQKVPEHQVGGGLENEMVIRAKFIL